MTPSEILRQGKANIIGRGWCQGDELAIHGPPDGPCCAATAMNVAGGCDHWRQIDDAIELLKDAVGVNRRVGIATWNDAPGRTVEEVLAAYDRAIEAAISQETANV